MSDVASEKPAWFVEHEKADAERFDKMEKKVADATSAQTRVLAVLMAFFTAVAAVAHAYISSTGGK